MKNAIVLTLFLLFSCSGQKLSSYKDETPKLNLREFFKGNLYALGIVQDRSGQVTKRFKVDIKASWRDNVVTLNESFLYSDNTTSSRVWQLQEIRPGVYEGRAGDVEGVATGETAGNAFSFEYVLNVPVGKKTYEVKFDDWMYLLDNQTLMAKSKMRKWGFDLGEVTLVMMKKETL
jgi:hypothetical protein